MLPRGSSSDSNACTPPNWHHSSAPFGQSPGTYYAHHIGMHHPEENLEADASTTIGTAERTATTTLGLRWQLGRALYVQGSGGAALTWTDDANGPRRHWWSPVGVAAVGWRRTIPDAVLGFELRASALRNDTTTVSTVAAVLSLGHAW